MRHPLDILRVRSLRRGIPGSGVRCFLKAESCETYSGAGDLTNADLSKRFLNGPAVDQVFAKEVASIACLHQHSLLNIPLFCVISYW